MKIVGFKKLFGPNIYTERPLLGMWLDLETYAERHSATFPGFTERLMAAFLSLYVLAAFIGLGVAGGVAVVWFWDNITG